MHKNKFLILDIQRGMAWQGQAGSKVRWMVLCFGKMFHKSLYISIESSTTGNNVPSAGGCIAKTEENGYNSSKTNLQKMVQQETEIEVTSYEQCPAAAARKLP